MLVFQSLPAQALPQAFWHVISNGSRGVDVQAAEYLLKERGFMTSADSVFDSTTETAVRNFQAGVGLTQNGMIVGSTWPQLVMVVGGGSTGDEVRAIQALLNAKRSTSLAVNGTYNSATVNSLKSFQTHAGLASTGIVDSETWKNLIWHYQKVPTSSWLCYGAENGSTAAVDPWGTAATVGATTAAAGSVLALFNHKVAMRDVSLEHGGDIQGHVSHEVGMDVDLRTMQNDAGQCSHGGVEYWESDYDLAETQYLVGSIHAATGANSYLLKKILFNDLRIQQVYPKVVSEPNHDEHLHVRYCTPFNPNASYLC